MKKRLFLSIFILFVTIGLAAQSRDFAFHITNIKAESRNNLVRITWVDSPAARGPVYIYRSARPFGSSIPANIKPITVGYGVQYYIDDIEDLTGVFYFIAASEISGRRYDYVFPNINSVAVNLLQNNEQITDAFDSQEFPPVVIFEPVNGITNLWTRKDGERVIITYTTTTPEKIVVLYRSAQPLNKPLDLLSASVVRYGISSPFSDTPVPGHTWYYAIINEDDILNGNIRLTPGVNSTAAGIAFADERAKQDFLRPIPLPFLTLNNFISDGFLTNTSGEFTQKSNSLNSSGDAQKKENLPELRTPRVFSVDLKAPANGDESELYHIIRDFFGKRQWADARNSLLDYLSLPRTKEAQARGRFYLGQTQYFTGNYKEALWEFLFFKSVNPGEANVWISAVLEAMVQ